MIDEPTVRNAARRNATSTSGSRPQNAVDRLRHHHRAEAHRRQEHLVGVAVVERIRHLPGEAFEDRVEPGDVVAGEVGGEGPVGEGEVEIEIPAEQAHQEDEDDESR